MLSINSLLRGVEEFPTLPTVYLRLNEVMSNNNSTANDVAEILSDDQACAVKILKTANCSIYGLIGKVDSIAQAIFFIGYREVKNLVLSLGIMDIFKKMDYPNSFNPVELWKHSIGVGVIARALSIEMKVKDVENYFLAGIIHDIGKLVFFRTFESEYCKTVNFAIDNKIPIRNAEVELLGVTHTLAGELIADKWHLPKNLKNVIRYHHNGMVKQQVDPLVACIHLADILARMYGMGNSGDEVISEPNVLIWDALGLPQNAITLNWNYIMNSYKESLAIFDLNK